MEIPVLWHDRTVGTRKESGTGERKDPGKRGRSMGGKSPMQSEDVMRSEMLVAKSVSQPSRKAAIVYAIPVP